jgi:hypothetical protein
MQTMQRTVKTVIPISFVVGFLNVFMPGTMATRTAEAIAKPATPKYLQNNELCGEVTPPITIITKKQPMDDAIAKRQRERLAD